MVDVYLDVEDGGRSAVAGTVEGGHPDTKARRLGRRLIETLDDELERVLSSNDVHHNAGRRIRYRGSRLFSQSKVSSMIQ